MHAGDLSRSTNFNFKQGDGASLDTQISPLGMGFSFLGLGLKTSSGSGHTGYQPVVTANRGSSQHFDISFTFEVEIATSDSPYLAGQPSDIIIGGGASLRVMRAVEVLVDAESSENVDDPSAQDKLYCVIGRQTSEWLPEQVTTFVLSVFEIEMMIERLALQYDIDVKAERFNGTFEGETNEATLLGIENWRKVLQNYRAITVNDKTPSIGEAMNHVLDHLHVVFASGHSSLSSYFDDFTTEMNDASSYRKFLASGLDELNAVRERLRGTFEDKQTGKLVKGGAAGAGSAVSGGAALAGGAASTYANFASTKMFAAAVKSTSSGLGALAVSHSSLNFPLEKAMSLLCGVGRRYIYVVGGNFIKIST